MLLIKGNVERIAESPAMIERLKREGFRALEEVAEDNQKIEDIDLSELTVAELRELAKKNDLEGYSVLNKAQLLELLKDVV